MRAASSDGRRVAWFVCDQPDGVSINCKFAGDGAYEISSKGKSRLLSFGQFPETARTTVEESVLVERNQKIWYSYRARP